MFGRSLLKPNRAPSGLCSHKLLGPEFKSKGNLGMLKNHELKEKRFINLPLNKKINMRLSKDAHARLDEGQVQGMVVPVTIIQMTRTKTHGYLCS